MIVTEREFVTGKHSLQQQKIETIPTTILKILEAIKPSKSAFLQNTEAIKADKRKTSNLPWLKKSDSVINETKGNEHAQSESICYISKTNVKEPEAMKTLCSSLAQENLIKAKRPNDDSPNDCLSMRSREETEDNVSSHSTSSDLVADGVSNLLDTKHKWNIWDWKTGIVYIHNFS